MSDRLYVGTRKGLFLYERNGRGRWKIEKTAFVGDPVTYVLPDERDGTIYAALNLGHFGVKLHRSFDSGDSFHEVTAPAYPKGRGCQGRGARGETPLVPLRSGIPSAGGALGGNDPGRLFSESGRAGGSTTALERAGAREVVRRRLRPSASTR
jgi:hypothetical protein